MLLYYYTDNKVPVHNIKSNPVSLISIRKYKNFTTIFSGSGNIWTYHLDYFNRVCERLIKEFSSTVHFLYGYCIELFPDNCDIKFVTSKTLWWGSSSKSCHSSWVIIRTNLMCRFLILFIDSSFKSILAGNCSQIVW